MGNLTLAEKLKSWVSSIGWRAIIFGACDVERKILGNDLRAREGSSGEQQSTSQLRMNPEPVAFLPDVAPLFVVAGRARMQRHPKALPAGRIEFVTLPDGTKLKGQNQFKEDQYAPKK
jgi:hypothetical protein